jgi:hypothetical protein
MKLNTVPEERGRTVTRLLVNTDEDGVRPASGSLHVTESFEIELRNDGAPKHVNLVVKGEAEPYVSVEANNVYVDEDDTVEVVVGPTPGELTGELELTVDYGSDSASVDLVVGDKSEAEPSESVEVDESLSQPMNPTEADDDIPRVDVAVTVVLGLAAFFSLISAVVFQGFEVIGVVLAALAILGVAFVRFISSSGNLRPKD